MISFFCIFASDMKTLKVGVFDGCAQSVDASVPHLLNLDSPHRLTRLLKRMTGLTPPASL